MSQPMGSKIITNSMLSQKRLYLPRPIMIGLSYNRFKKVVFTQTDNDWAQLSANSLGTRKRLTAPVLPKVRLTLDPARVAGR